MSGVYIFLIGWVDWLEWALTIPPVALSLLAIAGAILVNKRR